MRFSVFIALDRGKELAMKLAHIAIDENGGRREQSLKDHTLTTARYAAENLEGVGLASVGRLCGMLHDMGKATQKFSEYLEQSVRGEAERGSVDHSTVGMIWLFDCYHGKLSKEADGLCEVAAYAIGAHHGLFDCITLENGGENGMLRRMQKDRQDLCYDEAVRVFFKECDVSAAKIDELFSAAVTEYKGFCSKLDENISRCMHGKKKSEYYFSMGLLARLVLSALMDADRRDTAEFMSGIKRDKADSRFWDFALAHEESKLKELRARAVPNELNALRAKISDDCYAFAEREGGIYRLNAPTGSGKTLAVLRYAMHHAQLHQKKRVYYIAPLLTVLDQNAEVIKDYVGDYVLEHTSDVLKEELSEAARSRYEILSESWDAPIVITTLVQFLNTLFEGRTSCVRRFNALSDSVIILDEIQSLPVKLTTMTNSALNFLAENCGATIIACSATQPDSSHIPIQLRTSKECEIAKIEDDTPFMRNRVVDRCSKYGYTTEELAGLALEASETRDSVLFICNTKNSAHALYEELKSIVSKRPEEIRLFHLSAAMCKKHREDTLNAINGSLRKYKTICVSTQVVEAGVDFSFECVIRVCAGMDSIAQAAGRCNRSWEYPDICEVWIVNSKDENIDMLSEIRNAQNATLSVLDGVTKGDNLLQPQYIKLYYDKYYGLSGVKEILNYPLPELNSDMYALLSTNDMKRSSVQECNKLLNQSFKTAGKNFSVFDEKTAEAIVPYNEQAKEIIADLCSERAKHDVAFVKRRLSHAKPYTVSLYDNQVRDFSDAGYLTASELYLILTEQCYDAEVGVVKGKNIF